MGIFPMQGIQDYEELVNEFFLRIFGLAPREYGITDQSSVRDFRGLNGLDTAEQIEHRVFDEYGVTINAGDLVFDAIKRIAKGG